MFTPTATGMNNKYPSIHIDMLDGDAVCGLSIGRDHTSLEVSQMLDIPAPPRQLDPDTTKLPPCSCWELGDGVRGWGSDKLPFFVVPLCNHYGYE